MQTLFLPAVMILSAFITSLIGLTIYTLLRDEKKGTSKQNDEREHVSNEDMFADKASKVLHFAQEKANQIVSEAELAGIRSIASKKVNTASLEKTYEEDLAGLAQEARKQLTLTADQIKVRYDQFVTESENIIAHHITQNQHMLDSHVEKMVEANEKSFESFMQTWGKKIDEAMNSEISNVVKLVENYAAKRYQLIDMHIVDLVAETTRLTLGKALTTKDHTENVIQALEEAKQIGLLTDKKDDS
jgi:hypothetical protein